MTRLKMGKTKHPIVYFLVYHYIVNPIQIQSLRVCCVSVLYLTVGKQVGIIRTQYSRHLRKIARILTNDFSVLQILFTSMKLVRFEL